MPDFGTVEFDEANNAYVLKTPTLEEIQRKLAKALAHDMEQKIHGSLVALGWGPPGGPTADAYEATCAALHHWRAEAHRLADLAGCVAVGVNESAGTTDTDGTPLCVAHRIIKNGVIVDYARTRSLGVLVRLKLPGGGNVLYRLHGPLLDSESDRIGRWMSMRGPAAVEFLRAEGKRAFARDDQSEYYS